MTPLSYKIEPELEKKLKNISGLCSSVQEKLKSLTEEHREYIRRNALISNIGASTRIENAILTNVEIDWLDETLGKDARQGSFEKHKAVIEDKLSKDKQRSIEEVAGLRQVQNLVYAQARELFPIRETDLRELHRQLLEYYSAASHYIGQYKIAPNGVIERVGNKVTREIFKTAEPGPITAAAMRDLIAWYNKVLPEHLWPLAVITEFVYRFLAIHPFQDGNGRLGRALFHLGMLHSPDESLSFVAPYLAIDRQIEKVRPEYYIVLRQCSGGIYRPDPTEYKIERFLNFMLKMMERSLTGDIKYYHDKYIAYQKLGPRAVKTLKCFREHPETTQTTGALAGETGMNRRTVIRSLHELTDAGFLQELGKGPGTHYQLIF